MASGNVENWLGSLLKETLHSVHMVIKNAWVAIEDPNFQLIEFLNTYPAQVGRQHSPLFWLFSQGLFLSSSE